MMWPHFEQRYHQIQLVGLYFVLYYHVSIASFIMKLLFSWYLIIVRYEPGDHIAIYPENNTSLVEQIGTRLNIDLAQVVSLDCIDGMTLRLIVRT